MEYPRPQPGTPQNGPAPGPGPSLPESEPFIPVPGPANRLNLLLSYAGWHCDTWAERLPLLLEPLGIRAVRACTGQQATEVIRKVAPIHIAVVDLGLPLQDGPREGVEEGGPRVLDLLARLEQPPPTVVVKRSRTHRDDSREIAAALRAGAFAVVDRPRDSSDLELLLEVLRRCLRRYYHGRWPGLT